ncbi:hypothetical protein COCMIDRAFT_27993 [Bipolaris oryzae ATCC 44560]|uniref:Uncharacterized protein n=1 Tax=Bipolaris oryzae ATCC 44560 TaxID=930090 RepID=W6YVT6_COCMI|nr:uncharacterized protein COCMIDRAFT_27993 [Bipolaris oryzae ATCC 44560]EUC43532.1 hypothetical protein COCMIDRAFT_27993 [Bipolaris oryzae ATCC 44560]
MPGSDIRTPAASIRSIRRLHRYGAGAVRTGGSCLITDYGPAGGVSIRTGKAEASRIKAKTIRRKRTGGYAGEMSNDNWGNERGLLGREAEAEAMEDKRGSKGGLMGQVWVRQLRSRSVVSGQWPVASGIMKGEELGRSFRWGNSPPPTATGTARDGMLRHVLQLRRGLAKDAMQQRALGLVISGCVARVEADMGDMGDMG